MNSCQHFSRINWVDNKSMYSITLENYNALNKSQKHSDGVRVHLNNTVNIAFARAMHYYECIWFPNVYIFGAHHLQFSLFVVKINETTTKSHNPSVVVSFWQLHGVSVCVRACVCVQSAPLRRFVQQFSRKLRAIQCVICMQAFFFASPNSFEIVK